MLFFGLVESTYSQPTQKIEIMPQANFKTVICRHYEMGCCFKTKEQCPFAHGLTDIRKHCHFGFTCQRGLECQYPHHPQEIEYFTLKAQAKPKIMRDMGTQTDCQALPLATPEDFMTPTDLPPPPPGFTDDDTASETSTDGSTDGEMDKEEKRKWKVRKNWAMREIKAGRKTLADYDQTSWKTWKKHQRYSLTELQKKRNLATRKSAAKKSIKEGTTTPADYDDEWFQINRRTHKLMIVES